MNRKIRILVVDDDPVFQELVPEQLALFDFEAAVAVTGREAACNPTLAGRGRPRRRVRV